MQAHDCGTYVTWYVPSASCAHDTPNHAVVQGSVVPYVGQPVFVSHAEPDSPVYMSMSALISLLTSTRASTAHANNARSSGGSTARAQLPVGVFDECRGTGGNLAL